MSWLPEHYSYARDTRRTALYRDAIARAVKPADHVLDLGCGVGILGALCLEAGAQHVTGIDETPACDLAADVYRRADPAARTTAIRAPSFEVTLPDRADLIICDHVGFFGLDYGILGLLQDARSRFLAPGGRIMPAGLSLYMAPVGSEECHRLAFGWRAADLPVALHDLTAQAVNDKHAVTLTPDDVLGTPALIDSVDFLTETRQFLSCRTTIPITTAGEMHGLAGWFDSTLCDGVDMTNSPLAPYPIDRYQAFFPIDKPLNVRPGDSLLITMAMRPDDHVFAWTVHHEPSGTRFRHATLNSAAIRGQDLQTADQSRIAVPSDRAKAAQIILGYCDGTRSIREIADAVLRDHPDLLPSQKASEEFVLQWLTAWTR